MDSGSRAIDSASPKRRRVTGVNAFENSDLISSLAKGSVTNEQLSDRPISIVTYSVPEKKGLAEH